MKIKHAQTGLSLIEVVVAVAVVVVLVTGLVSSTTASLRAHAIAQRRGIATKLVQEGMEIVRSYRESGWSTFQSRDAGSGTTYCLATGVADFASASSTCTGNVTANGQPYSRSVLYTWRGAATPPYMEVLVTVAWTEGTVSYSSYATSFFTNW